MGNNRPRDKSGRFFKSKTTPQSTVVQKSSEMSGDKRPRGSEEGTESLKASGLAISPSRKKLLSEDTASWRSSPTFSTDFYPQYMRTHTASPTASFSEESSSQPTPNINQKKGATPEEGNQSERVSGEINQGLPPKEGSHGVHNWMNTPEEGNQSERVPGEVPKGGSHGEHNWMNSDPTIQLVSKAGHSSVKERSDNQSFEVIPKGSSNQDKIMILSNTQGKLINTADLEEVMARAMSKVMGQLETITSDVKQVPAIKAATAKLGREMIQVRQDCYGIKESVNDLRQKEEQQELKHEALVKEVRELKSKLEDSSKVNNPNQPNKDKDQDPKMEALRKDAAARKINLIIEGIPEPDGEDNSDQTTEQQVKTFFTTTLRLPSFELADAFRLGKPRKGPTRPRPIKVKFTSTKERDWVWRAKSVLAQNRDVQFSIKEDLPPQLRAQMSALIRVSQTARKYPESYYNVSIHDYKVHINGSSYSADQLESLPSNLRPSVTSTPGNIYVVIFYGRDSKFSNHYLCSFTWDNREFSSIEQYLAFRRACLAGRKDLANQAMRSRDPADSKRLMHTLKLSDSEPQWIDQRKDILFSGLIAKFSQNNVLRRYLRQSEKRQLGEASTDTTWGIGRSLTDKLALDPTKWIGENLLGKTLMEVREELAYWATQDSEEGDLQPSSKTT